MHNNSNVSGHKWQNKNKKPKPGQGAGASSVVEPGGGGGDFEWCIYSASTNKG